MIQVANTVMIPREEYDSLVQQRDELLAAWKESNEALGLLSFHCDGVVQTANPPHEIYNKTYDIYRRHQAAIAKVKPYQGLPTTGTT